MRDRITYYKLTTDPNNGYLLGTVVANVADTEPDNIIINRGCLCNNATGKFEPIVKIVREDNETNRKRYEIAHKKNSEVTDEEIYNAFPLAARPWFCDSEEVVIPNYKMVYDSDIDEITDRYIFKSVFFDEIITITTIESEITVNTKEINFITHYYGHGDVYRADLHTKGNIISLDVCSQTFDIYDGKLVKNIHTDSLSLNLDTGLTYHFKGIDPVSRKCADMKNVTTGSLNCSKFAILPDLIFDDIKNIVSEYWVEKMGVEPKFYDLSNRIDTLRSIVFNPNCNVLYLYKPFFNTRFRTYFKREDVTTNHFVELCKLIGLDYDEKYIKLAANCEKDLFVAKCLSDAGVKKVDNQIAMIETLHAYNGWTNGILNDFIDKFYGENTDFLYPMYNKCKNNMDALYTYVKKAIPYTSEDEFVAMFNRSFVQHNKYWKRSLYQVATVIKMGGGSRELIRKACSYGLNKIQSDNIDLAYDKILSRNYFINYAKEITDSECTIGESVFKLPLELHECASLLEEFKLDDKAIAEMSLDVAQGNYHIIFVKDKYGGLLGYMKYRGIFLLNADFTKGTMKASAEDARIACIEWCDRFGVKQYRCDALKYSRASGKSSGRSGHIISF